MLNKMLNFGLCSGCVALLSIKYKDRLFFHPCHFVNLTSLQQFRHLLNSVVCNKDALLVCYKCHVVITIDLPANLLVIFDVQSRAVFNFCNNLVKKIRAESNSATFL